jgi:CMP-N-acetylneuraminic acid synthetase
MKINIFVPIKLNSQRLKNKMLLPLGNKLLCQHIFDTLLEVKKEIDCDIYCYCSDETIINFLPTGVLFLKRDSNLDSNETKGLSIYNSFIKQIDGNVYCLCHATSPFIKKDSIIDGLNKVINEKYDSSFSVSKIQTFSWFKNKPINYDLNDIIKTQDIEPVFYETSAFFIFEKNILEKYNRRIGFDPYMILTDRIESIDIDEYEDYDLANAIINTV